jgi:hypothetical protein
MVVAREDNEFTALNIPGRMLITITNYTLKLPHLRENQTL